MRIAQEMIDELVAHAREEAPDECCGMVAARDGRAVGVLRGVNAAASPLRYEFEPAAQIRVLNAIDDAGDELGAIYHSHPRSPAVPSQTDINLAFWPGTDEALYPGTLYVIVGLAAEPPEVRAFRIADRRRGAEEIALEIDA